MEEIDQEADHEDESGEHQELALHLDEVTVADVGHEHAPEIMRLIRRMADELGKHIVIVLHDINFAANYADRIVAMRAGKIVADGTANEVMQSEVLAEVYGTSVDVREIDGRPHALYYR